MRTALTLDPDLQQLLEAEARRTHQPFARVVNEALRRSLTLRRRALPGVSVLVSDSPLRPGIDGKSFNALADELDDPEVLARARR